MMAWDLSVDFQRVDADGLTHAHVDDLSSDAEAHLGEYLVAGDEDADPAVAQVVSVSAEGVILLRVLPGHADLHRELLGSQPGRPSGPVA